MSPAPTITPDASTVTVQCLKGGGRGLDAAVEIYLSAFPRETTIPVDHYRASLGADGLSYLEQFAVFRRESSESNRGISALLLLQREIAACRASC